MSICIYAGAWGGQKYSSWLWNKSPVQHFVYYRMWGKELTFADGHYARYLMYTFYLSLRATSVISIGKTRHRKFNIARAFGCLLMAISRNLNHCFMQSSLPLISFYIFRSLSLKSSLHLMQYFSHSRPSKMLSKWSWSRIPCAPQTALGRAGEQLLVFILMLQQRVFISYGSRTAQPP